MNLDKIRNMSDEQLTRFINDVSQRNSIICSKCGGIIISKERKCLMISINDKGTQKSKKLVKLNQKKTDPLSIVKKHTDETQKNVVKNEI